MRVLVTVGHGTLAAGDLTALLRGAEIEALVDVRTAPGSRRLPHLARAAMEEWLPAAGVDYAWEADLGGFRRPDPHSRNVALRHPSFRGYADWMHGERFGAALERVLERTRRRRVAVMCSESLWWRCHRRLIADRVALCVDGVEPRHLLHDGSVAEHRLTEGVRREGAGVVYDVGVTGTLPG